MRKRSDAADAEYNFVTKHIHPMVGIEVVSPFHDCGYY
jgi:hypothetical protein